MKIYLNHPAVISEIAEADQALIDSDGTRYDSEGPLYEFGFGWTY